MAFGRLGLGAEDDVVSEAAVGDEELGAVDQEATGRFFRSRPHPGDIRTGSRLGDADRGDLLALRDREQVFLLLIGRRVLRQVRRGHVGRDERRDGDAAGRLAKLLGEEGDRQHVAAGPAGLLREAEAEEAVAAHQRHQLQWELPFALGLLDLWHDVVVDEVATDLLELAMDIIQLEQSARARRDLKIAGHLPPPFRALRHHCRTRRAQRRVGIRGFTASRRKMRARGCNFIVLRTW